MVGIHHLAAEILAHEGVAPDAFHHLTAKRREVLAELRRPLRHAIELFLLQKHFLVHINFNNKFDTEMALTHNLFVNVDEFANMGPAYYLCSKMAKTY